MYTEIRYGKPARASVDVVFITAERRVADGDLPQAWSKRISALLTRPEVSGEPGELTLDADGDRRLIVIGLGDSAGFSARRLRAAGGHLVAALHRMKASGVTLHLGPTAAALMPLDRFAQAIAEGIVLGSFVFDLFKPDAHKPGPDSLIFAVSDPALRSAAQRGLDFAAAANYSRRLAATPPNIATPRFIADEAKKLARQTGLRCTVFAGAELKRRRFVGLSAVGGASQNPPCLIELVYTPKNTKHSPNSTVVLVGKTITFDSGGLSLKINNSMRLMKYDKSGGMAVLGAMRQIAAMKPAVRVVGLLAAAENLISSTSYRPDDILRYANGVTVEITNTDAEGRLVLADALVYGGKTYKPAAMIDLATLTGGCVVALGTKTAGLWCDDDDLRRQLQQAAERSGEAIWPMPITDEHREGMKGNHADLVNSTLKTAGSPCNGAAFLARFIEPGVKWAHLDIAGPADTESAAPPFAVGPTGFGARLLMEYIAALK